MAMSAARNILLVDDSRISRLMLKAIVLSHFPDWRVDEAEDADAAIKQCQNNHYDVITLDMNMPGIDGLTVAPQLQIACPDARMALLTANVLDQIQEKAQQQGLTFIPKPITEEKIVRYLKSV